MFNNELFQNYANIEHFQDGSEDPIANAEQDVMRAQQALAQAQQAQQAPTGNNVNSICDTIRQAANQCEAREASQQSGDMGDDTQTDSPRDMMPSSGDMGEDTQTDTQSAPMDDMPSSMEQFQSNNGLKMIVDNNNMKLLLHGVLYACVFYLLSHPDTLRFFTKNVSQLNATNTHVVMSLVFVGCYMLLSTFL